MTAHIFLTEDAKDIDWQSLRTAFTSSGIRDGRSAKQLSQVFKQSHGCCFARVNDQLIGTARSVSDHTHRTYIADVWTHPAFRRHGVATRMLRALLKRLHHHHVYVFTDYLWLDLYAKVGFEPADKQPHFMGNMRLVVRAPRFVEPPE